MFKNWFASKKKTPIIQTGRRKAAGTLFNHHTLDDVISNMTTMPDLDEVLNRAGIGREALRSLEYDDEIAAALETRREAVIATPWRIEPVKGGQPAGEFIHSLIAPHIDDIIRAAWDAIPYGYSVSEVIYDRIEGGKVGIKQIRPLSFELFIPRTDGQLALVTNFEEPVDTEFKFLFTTRRASYRNPYGEALLSRLYWPWWFRQQGWTAWVKWLERWGDPILLGKSPSDPEGLADALLQAHHSAVVGIRSDEEVEAVTPATGSGHFPDFEHAVIKRIQKMILGQTLTTDVQSGGSYAAAKVHNEVRDDRRLADVRLVSKTIQHLINALAKLNNIPAPLFVMEDGRKLNEDRAKRDYDLVTAGVIKLTESYLLRAYDFEKGDFEIPEAAPTPTPTPMKAALQFAEKPQRFTAGQEEVESLADTTLTLSRAPIDNEQIKAAIIAATDEDDLIERLGQLTEGTEGTDFQALTERAFFAADVLGYSLTAKGKH